MLIYSHYSYHTMLDIGNKAPDFTLPNQAGEDTTLSNYLGKKVVLYFYPKDMTSGCTLQAQGFRDHLQDFADTGAVILGVSKDSVKRHQKFIEKESLNFTLLADEEATICELYQVYKEKSMYGRKYMGIERSTFLINEKGIITKVWRNVKVPGHVEEVLEETKNI